MLPADTAGPEDLCDWFTALHASGWLAASSFGVLVMLFFHGTPFGATTLGWGFFMLANASAFRFLCAQLINRGPRFIDRKTLFTTFAALLGAGWALGFYLLANSGSEAEIAAAFAISAGAVLLGIPVFSHQGASYFVLLATYSIPMLWFLFLHHGALATWVAVTLCLVPVVQIARLHQRSLSTLTKLLNTVLAIRNRRALFASRSDHADFVDYAQSQIGRVRQALLDSERLQGC
ncbi:MAG: hypothetical protein EXR86_07245 [Gammaproteobacteria bacterium]|nr:hypothetical protein [Gammaproteobacteria bacterium]